MEHFSNGDIITLRYDEERYIPGKIIQIEPLTLHDIIHVRLYDMFIAGGPGGYDNVGEYRNRVHNLPEGMTDHAPIFDSLAMTSTAFEDSDPVVVDHSPVEDSELVGYTVWVAARREAAERRGLIRYDLEEEVDEDDFNEDEEDVENPEEGEPAPDQDEGASDTEVDEIVVEVRPWHNAVYDIPLRSILRDLSDVLTDEPYDQTEIGRALIRKVEDGGSEIGLLVGRLVNDGDYAAGQELLDYGDRAVPALAEALHSADDTQTVEDICQILADLGTDSSYEALARGVEERIDRIEGDEGARAAARSFLYAVMLTGGTPEPLKSRLGLIERMDHPELREDVESAMNAMRQGAEDAPTEPQERSRDPLGM